MRAVPRTFPPENLWIRDEEARALASYDLPLERLRAIERLVTAGLVVGGTWLLITRPGLRRVAAESARLLLTAGLPIWLAREMRAAWHRAGAAPADVPFET
jgi:hypothetical protein